MTKKTQPRRRYGGYNDHWFVQSLKFNPQKLPGRPRQHSSSEGQLSLPITPDEADRRKAKRSRRQ